MSEIDQEWLQNYNWLVAYVKDTGWIPKADSEDLNVQKLAAWLSRQNVGCVRKFPHYTEEKNFLLTSLLPGWPYINAMKFYRTLDQLKRYAASHNGALPPNPGSRRGYDEERRLNSWLGALREERRHHPEKFPKYKEEALDTLFPGWDEWVVPSLSEAASYAWGDGLDSLTTFLSNTGRVPSEWSQKASEVELAYWFQGQKASHSGVNGSSLKAERLARLNKALPGWWEESLPGEGEEFIKYLKALKTFLKVNGRGPSPLVKGSLPGEVQLFKWLGIQRYLSNKPEIQYPEAKINSISGLLPDWSRVGVLRRNWEENLQNVLRYFNTHGSWPASNNPDGFWLQQQRTLTKLDPKSLTTEQLDRLNRLNSEAPGWVMGASPGLPWRENLESLKEWVRVSSGARPQRGTPLWVWLQGQKKRYDSGFLSSKEESMLTEVFPDWKDVRLSKLERARKSWNSSLEELRDFVKTTGGAPIANTTSLSKWLYLQRSLVRAGKLSAEDEAKITEILPYWVDPYEQIWEKNLQDFKTFCVQRGVPPHRNSTQKSEALLGTWMNRMLSSHNLGKLTTQRVSRLNEVLPGWLERRYTSGKRL